MNSPARSPDLLYLPAQRSDITISPLRWPMDLRGTLCLHGALHMLANVGHDRERAQCQRPLIVLRPLTPDAAGASNRWDALWLHKDSHKLAGKTFPVELFGAIRRVSVSEMSQVSVEIPRSKQQAVKVRGLTPMLIKQTSGGFFERCDRGIWLGALQQSLRRFLGAQPWAERAIFEIARFDQAQIETDTRWSGRRISGFWWEWSGVVDANGLLALRVAQEVGIGSTVSRGFGRIKVQEC